MGTVRVGETDLMGRDQGQGQMEKGSRIEWEQMEKKEKGRRMETDGDGEGFNGEGWGQM